MRSLAILLILGNVLPPLALAQEPQATDQQAPRTTTQYVLTVPLRREAGVDLFNVDIQGNELQQITKGPGEEIEPAWSPDGKQLAFVMHLDDKFQIYVVNADGSDEKNLTLSNASERNPAWSPDSKKIVFTSDRTGRPNVFQMNADGSHPVNLTNDPTYSADPAWSPDGKRISFASSRSGPFRVYVMNPDGSGVVDLLKRPEYGFLYPAWSPDGKQIVFGGRAESNSVQLHVVNADGQGLQQFTFEGTCNSFPAWSPDGRYLAYIRRSNQGDSDLLLYDFLEEKHTEISKGNVPTDGPRPSWTPFPAPGK